MGLHLVALSLQCGGLPPALQVLLCCARPPAATPATAELRILCPFPLRPRLQDFFAQQIAPELQSAAVGEAPILKADALKFVTTFRSQLPKDTLLGLFPALIK